MSTKLQQVEHIGLAVKDLEQAIQTWTLLLNAPPYQRESVESEQVETVFFKTGQTKIELLGATAPTSPIAKFLEKRGEGIHHIAFAVEDIKKEMERLQSCGFRILNETPKVGADNKLICFLHPADMHGVLVELCQERTPD
jgi:methylmalonyl-CoA/ethylmalonyl-CoA epimerase